jgi:hypothetical protein
MNKEQAIKILTEVANLAQKNGLIGDIMSAGTVYTALVVLSQDIPLSVDETNAIKEENSHVELDDDKK